MRTILAAIVLALCATLATAQFGGGGPFGGGGGYGGGGGGYGNNGYGNDNGGGGGQRESLTYCHAALLVSGSPVYGWLVSSIQSLLCQAAHSIHV